MSHFFTKVKQEELSALADLAALFDLAQLQTALAPGQVLKAQAPDGDGNIKFAAGTDDSGFSLPSGTAGQFLSSDGAGGAEFVDGPTPFSLPSGTSGQLLSLDGSGDPEFVDAPSIPSSLSDLLPPGAAPDGSVIKLLGGVWSIGTDASGDALPAGTTAGEVLGWDGAAWGPTLPPAIPATLSDLISPASFTVGHVLKVGVDPTDGTTKVWEVVADNMGDVLPSGMHEGDILTWSFSSGGGWTAEAPVGAPIDNQLCDGTQIMRYTEADLNIGGSTFVLTGDTNTVVIVLDDWGSTTGSANLSLQDGTKGQHVYIKNHSVADESNRSITISCGNNSDLTDGSIDLVNGAPGISLSANANMHLLCIDDSSTHGEWIIL